MFQLFRPGITINWTFIGLILVSGCQLFVDDADHEVYRVLENRQQEAVGINHDVTIDDPEKQKQNLAAPGWFDPAYDFVPNPLDSDVPSSFQTTTQPAAVTDLSAATQPAVTMDLAAATQPAEKMPAPKEWSLADVLTYAFRNSRDYQTAKEDLYLAALDLTLERHLWTPRLFNEIRGEYANYGQIRNFDHALSLVAEAGVRQQLPFGGEITASVINVLMRDLTNHITTAETGAVLLEAGIPLLRGAGPSAYESRYQAERDLIYAVRTFERFRRILAVDIADDYFSLQTLRQAIVNADLRIDALTYEVGRSQALWKAGRLIQLEVQRAEQDRLSAIDGKINAIQAYQTAIDQFKIRIGMPVEIPLEVAFPKDPTAEKDKKGPLEAKSLEESILMPDVSLEEAIKVGLKYRLDLLNDYDRIDDSRRGIEIARNNLLPDLDLFGSVRLDTDPDRLGTLKYNMERLTWRGGFNLELPLDRKEERNELRGAMIEKQQAQRNYELAQDTVRFQVRRAMRRADQEKTSLRIQIINRDLALERRKAVKLRLDKGEVSNREVIEAEEALFHARNRVTEAQARYRLSVLEFRRDTGTLRIDELGQWTLTDDVKIKQGS